MARFARFSILRSVVVGTGALLILGSSLAIAGWILDIQWLRSISQGWVTMKVNTATCFLLSGASLCLLANEHALKPLRTAGTICAAAVAAVAALTLGEHLTGLDFGIDQALMTQPATAEDPASPGRMSAATAFSFLMIAGALLGLDRRNRHGHRPALALALVAAMVGLLAIAGYLYGVKALYAFSPFSSMALHTAVLILTASVGILCARPDRGPFGILTADGLGSVMARRILPLAIILPFLLGWLRLQGERAGWYGFEFGLALFVTSNVIVFAALVWITAVSLNRADAQRKGSQVLLLEERTRLAGMIDSAMDAVITVNEAQRITLFNPAAERMFGIASARIIGQPLDDLIPGHLRARHPEHIRGFGRTGVSKRNMSLGTVTGLRATGEEFPLEATISQINVSGQKYYTAILRDISERKQAEEGLLRFRTAMETSLDGIFLMDFETFRYLDANETGCRMLGYTREELLGLRTLDTNPGLTESGQRQRFDEARALGSQHVITEREGRTMRHRNGTTFPTEVARRYVRIGDREIMVGIARDSSERLRAEEKLRDSEKMLRKVLDGMGPSLFAGLMTPEGFLLQANQPALAAANLNPEDVLDIPFSRTYWWSYSMPVAEQLEAAIRAAAAGIPCRYDVQVRVAPDILMWIDFSLNPLRDDSGRVEFIVASASVITERKLAEQALSESEASLAAAQAIAHLGNWERDLATMTGSYSAEMFRLLYRNPALGVPAFAEFMELVHPEDRGKIEQAYARTAEAREPYSLEYRTHPSLGPVKHLYATIHVIRDAGGRPVRTSGTALDITGRKAAEAALQESEARFQTMVNSMPQLAWIMRADGYIYWYNQRWYEYTGTTPEQMEGWGWQSVHDPAMLPGVMENWTRAIAAGEPFEMEFALRGADGRFRTFLTRGQPLKDSAGQVIQWFGTNTDVEAIKEAREQIQRLNTGLEQRVAQRTAELHAKNKELETFSYSVSHDLKAPLRGIDGYSRLLLTEYGDRLDGDARTFLRNIRSATAQMQQLIDDLLSYSKLEQRTLAENRIDLRALVETVLKERTHDIDRVRLEVAMHAGSVRADREGLSIVLRNLIDNAVKFSRHSDPPVVEIRSRIEGDRHILSVSDNGTGFDMKYHDRIFQIFQRLHRAEDYPGTGVGLAIVHKAVERMGGRVWAESEPGKGATFYLDLPGDAHREIVTDIS